jgi:ATP-dependent Clp protease ATP-binding subunit ClpC
LRRALQRYVEDPLSDALIQGTINTRPAFIEIYLEGDGLFYRQVGQNVENTEGAVLCSS